jgi:hypothetical protein
MEASSLHLRLETISDIPKFIERKGQGRVTVVDEVVYFEGEVINNAVTRRILWGLSEGYDMSAYINFLDEAMENPSQQAVDEMYLFMEANNMGIFDDGCIIGYKKVNAEFRDIYTNTFNNSPGQILKMRRNAVDDRRDKTCSTGFHFCSMSYLPKYGRGTGDRIVIVKVRPRHIVSVPIDYNNAKVRCCEYEVIAEYTGPDRHDLLGTRAVWSVSDFHEVEEDEVVSTEYEIGADDEDDHIEDDDTITEDENWDRHSHAISVDAIITLLKDKEAARVVAQESEEITADIATVINGMVDEFDKLRAEFDSIADEIVGDESDLEDFDPPVVHDPEVPVGQNFNLNPSIDGLIQQHFPNLTEATRTTIVEILKVAVNLSPNQVIEKFISESRKDETPEILGDRIFREEAIKPVVRGQGGLGGADPITRAAKRIMEHYGTDALQVENTFYDPTRETTIVPWNIWELVGELAAAIDVAKRAASPSSVVQRGDKTVLDNRPSTFDEDAFIEKYIRDKIATRPVKK